MRVLLLLLLLTAAPVSAQWSANTIPVVRPSDFGATSECASDELPALNAAIAALPSTGGIVRLAGPNGTTKCTRKDGLLVITKPNVLLWGENRAAELREVSNGLQDMAAIAFTASGGGVYGLKITGDSTRRWTTPNSNNLVFWQTADNEVVGNDISGHSVGVFFYGSPSTAVAYVQGNYVHHTWADHIHFTNGFNTSWVWDNRIFNESPSNGDDGVACVTYGPGSPKCRNMEWWSNVVYHSGSGRGFACVGGDTLDIHDNWAIGTSSAGMIFASEGSKNTEACANVTARRNTLLGTAWNVTSHSAILVSGLNAGAPAVSNITLDNNIAYGTQAGAYRAEGTTSNIVQTNTVTTEPGTPPVPPEMAIEDTSELKTHNVSFAPSDKRAGLYRIHVRQPSAGGLQMSYEYVVKGEPGRVAAWVAWQVLRGSVRLDQRSASGTAYAVVLSPLPVALSSGLSGVTTAEMRAGANGGALGSWLWDLVN